METTIVKVGNSLGSRFSRAYLEKLGIGEGDKVEITVRKARPDKQKALAALRAISNLNGSLANLDVEKWQNERRGLQTKKDSQLRDILGR